MRRAAPHLRRARDRANRLAHHLAGRRRRPGDHVGLYLRERRRVPRGHAGRVQAAGRPDQREPPLRRRRAALPARRQRRRSSRRLRRRPSSRPTVDAGRRRGARRVRARAGEVGRRLRGRAGRARRPSRSAIRAAAATTTTSSTRAARPACPRAWCGARRTPSSRASAAATRCRLHGRRSTSPRSSLDRIVDGASCYLPLAPLMHAAAQWTSLIVVVRRRQGRAHAGLARPRRGVAGRRTTRRCNTITVVGDAVARPLLDAWDASPGRYDVSSLFAVGQRRRRPLSPAARRPASPRPVPTGHGDRRLRLVRGRRAGQRSGSRPGSAGRRRASARFTADARPRACSTRTCEPVEPGSGVIGRVALAGQHPARLLQRPGEDGRDLRRGRRPALGASPATWPPSRPTARSSCSAGLAVHQHRRREGLPRGGGGASCTATRRCTTCWWSACPTSAGGARSPRWCSPAPGAEPPSSRSSRDALPRHARRLQGAQAPRGRGPRRALAGRQGRLPLGRADRQRGCQRRLARLRSPPGGAAPRMRAGSAEPE